MKKVNLVGRAFGRVTSSQKVIDKLTASGFEKVSENGKSTVLLKRVHAEKNDNKQ